MKKRKIALFIGLIAVLVSSFGINIDAKENVNFIPYDEDYLDRNLERVELATKIEKSIMTYYDIEKVFEDTYPSYFGGMYISDDAKNLIIQVVEKNIPKYGTEEYKFYQVLTNMDDSIKIEFVENSFNELNEINNIVSNNIDSKESLKNNLNGVYVDVMNNTTVIELKEGSSMFFTSINDLPFEMQSGRY